MKKIFFKNANGLTLCGVWQKPQIPNKKAIILAHGITVTKDEDGIFPELAEQLNNTGFDVFRFDFQGHGESEGKSVDMTISGELDDLTAAFQEVRKNGYKDIGLLGASFGGGIAALFSSSNQQLIKALCLWNPCLNYDHGIINPTTPWISEKNEIRKKEINEQGWTTIGSRRFIIGKNLYDEMATTFPYEALKSITIPTVIFHGTNDRYIPYEDSQLYAKNLSNGKFISIEKGEHAFRDPKEARKEVLDKTVDFFKNK